MRRKGEKEWIKIEPCTQELWSTFKRYNKYIIVIPERDERKCGRKETFAVIMAKNFPKSMTDTKPEIQESWITSSRINTKKKGWRVDRMISGHGSGCEPDYRGRPRHEPKCQFPLYWGWRTRPVWIQESCLVLKSPGDISLRLGFPPAAPLPPSLVAEIILTVWSGLGEREGVF